MPEYGHLSRFTVHGQVAIVRPHDNDRNETATRTP